MNKLRKHEQLSGLYLNDEGDEVDNLLQSNLIRNDSNWSDDRLKKQKEEMLAEMFDLVSQNV